MLFRIGHQLLEVLLAVAVLPRGLRLGKPGEAADAQHSVAVTNLQLG
jgi:hypothetical protein